MRALILAVCLIALPLGALAQATTGGQVTLQGGLYGQDPGLVGRFHGDGLIRYGASGLQIGATFGLADDDALTDLRLIAFQEIGRRWTYGAELQSTTDAALGGADYALGFRLRYADAGGTVDSRLSLAQNGSDGAFSVTVAMDQSLTEATRVNGLLHRFSTNSETGDFFAIGLGAETDLSPRLVGYGHGLWALADDFSSETTTATLGLMTPLRPGLDGFAGLTARQTTGADPAIALTAGITLSLSGGGPLFDTDPFGQQLAHLGR